MKLTVTMVDYNPPDLNDQVPFSFALVRQIPGPDRPDYWLGRLDSPLRWVDEGRERQVEYVVVSARWQGTQIEPRVEHLPIGIAYVTDPSQMDDAELSFDKCRYVAIGTASETEGGSVPPGLGASMAGIIAPAFGLGKA